MDDRNRSWIAWVVAGVLVTAWVVSASVAEDENGAPSGEGRLPGGGVTPAATNPLDSQRAFGYLKELCAIGARSSGSAGMEKQRAIVVDYFKKAGANVSLQRFRAKNPLGGSDVPMANVIIEWHPERAERILLCTHYDTRPRPDKDVDPVKRRDGVFLGANDGASGVAVFMELAHLMPKLEGPLGVDFVLLDGEELVYVDPRDPYCLGSTWFAEKYVKEPPAHKYRWGVLLDMVGDANLQLYQEQFGASWHDTRPLVKSIWATAQRLGVKEFIPRSKFLVSQDDHLPLRNAAKIPTCDIIDFVDAFGNPPPITWHTTKDDPQHCAASSLAKVGWVVYEWLRSEQLAATGRTDAKPPGAEGVKPEVGTGP